METANKYIFQNLISVMKSGKIFISPMGLRRASQFCRNSQSQAEESKLLIISIPGFSGEMIQKQGHHRCAKHKTNASLFRGGLTAMERLCENEMNISHVW